MSKLQFLNDAEKLMKGDEILKWIDHGTGLTLDELIDTFVSNPIEAKNLKDYIIEMATYNGEE